MINLLFILETVEVGNPSKYLFTYDITKPSLASSNGASSIKVLVGRMWAYLVTPWVQYCTTIPKTLL